MKSVTYRDPSLATKNNVDANVTGVENKISNI